MLGDFPSLPDSIPFREIQDPLRRASSIVKFDCDEGGRWFSQQKTRKSRACEFACHVDSVVRASQDDKIKMAAAQMCNGSVMCRAGRRLWVAVWISSSKHHRHRRKMIDVACSDCVDRCGLINATSSSAERQSRWATAAAGTDEVRASFHMDAMQKTAKRQAIRSMRCNGRDGRNAMARRLCPAVASSGQSVTNAVVTIALTRRHHSSVTCIRPTTRPCKVTIRRTVSNNSLGTTACGRFLHWTTFSIEAYFRKFSHNQITTITVCFP